MNTFELEEFTQVKITDIVVLSQKNRDPADNPGAQLKIRAKLSNDCLASFDGSLKGFLYTRSEASSTVQRGLDGVDEISDMPNITRAGIHLKSLHWGDELTGYALTIDHGMGGKSNIALLNCAVSNFKIDPKDGGTVEIAFTVESSDVTEKVFGKLATLKNRDVLVTLLAAEADQPIS